MFIKTHWLLLAYILAHKAPIPMHIVPLLLCETNTCIHKQTNNHTNTQVPLSHKEQKKKKKKKRRSEYSCSQQAQVENYRLQPRLEEPQVVSLLNSQEEGVPHFGVTNTGDV